jgi:hypothetical protein
LKGQISNPVAAFQVVQMSKKNGFLTLSSLIQRVQYTSSSRDTPRSRSGRVIKSTVVGQTGESRTTQIHSISIVAPTVFFCLTTYPRSGPQGETTCFLLIQSSSLIPLLSPIFSFCSLSPLNGFPKSSRSMDFDEEQDPMLKAAIEASLKDDRGNTGPSLPSQAPRNVVDLTYDSDDQSDVKEVFPKSNSVVESDGDEEAEQGMHDDEAELRRAIAMSLQDLQSDVEPVEPVPRASNSPSQGLLGLDRKKMEQERLARIQKRKAREFASPPGQPQAKLYKTEPISTGTPSVSHAKPSSPSSSSKDSTASVRPTARPALQWPLGTVKKTHVANTIRGDNEITIEEVIQRGDLELGIFSSFLWDMEWFFTKCDTWRTRFLLIMHAKEQEMVRTWSISLLS